MPLASVTVPDAEGVAALQAWYDWARPFAPSLKNPVTPLLRSYIDAL